MQSLKTKAGNKNLQRQGLGCGNPRKTPRIKRTDWCWSVSYGKRGKEKQVSKLSPQSLLQDQDRLPGQKQGRLLIKWGNPTARWVLGWVLASFKFWVCSGMSILLKTLARVFLLLPHKHADDLAPSGVQRRYSNVQQSPSFWKIKYWPWPFQAVKPVMFRWHPNRTTHPSESKRNPRSRPSLVINTRLKSGHQIIRERKI